MEDYIDKYYFLEIGFKQLCEKYYMNVPHFLVVPIWEDDYISEFEIGFNIAQTRDRNIQLKMDFIKWLIELFNIHKDERVLNKLMEFAADNQEVCEYVKTCTIPTMLEMYKGFCTKK